LQAAQSLYNNWISLSDARNIGSGSMLVNLAAQRRTASREMPSPAAADKCLPATGKAEKL
jgi:hypothetical protein